MDRERLVGLERLDVIWSNFGSIALLQGLAGSRVGNKTVTKSMKGLYFPLRSKG